MVQRNEVINAFNCASFVSSNQSDMSELESEQSTEQSKQEKQSKKESEQSWILVSEYEFNKMKKEVDDAVNKKRALKNCHIFLCNTFCRTYSIKNLIIEKKPGNFI